MSNSNLQRREFGKLAAGAFGGFAAGLAVDATSAQAADKEKPKLSVDPALLLSEPHVCKGLNACKGKGNGGGNDCAGQGACATAEKHTCGGQESCKGQGGCAGYPGQNTCKGKGHCAVPLNKKAWALARKQFEQLMKDVGKKVGEAP